MEWNSIYRRNGRVTGHRGWPKKGKKMFIPTPLKHKQIHKFSVKKMMVFIIHWIQIDMCTWRHYSNQKAPETKKGQEDRSSEPTTTSRTSTCLGCECQNGRIQDDELPYVTSRATDCCHSQVNWAMVVWRLFVRINFCGTIHPLKEGYWVLPFGVFRQDVPWTQTF